MFFKEILFFFNWQGKETVEFREMFPKLFELSSHISRSYIYSLAHLCWSPFDVGVALEH